MNPSIHQKKQGEFNTMTFTISGVNVCVANAIRRTILADIPIVVFRTTPHTENMCKIDINTTRLNNEIIKQRLSCIPIFLKPFSMPLANLLLDVDEENQTDTIKYLTTENFKIKNIETGAYLSKEDQHTIFPANEQTRQFIDFVRLRPTLSDSVPGERLKFTCELSIGNAAENGMFNVVSICSYGNSPNKHLIQQELAKKQDEWKAAGDAEEVVDFKSKDWMILDSQKIFLPDSFDFTIQTLGIYTNDELINIACSLQIKKLKELQKNLGEVEIFQSENTMQNSFDVILQNEDYTVGKVLEYSLYAKFFGKTLSYCGFCINHPHDAYGIIRIAYKSPPTMEIIIENLGECIAEAILVYEKIKQNF